LGSSGNIESDEKQNSGHILRVGSKGFAAEGE